MAATTAIAMPLQTNSVTTRVFECPNQQRYVLRIENETAWLFTREGTHRLTRTGVGKPAAYGNARYQVLLGEQQATIRAPAKAPVICRNKPQEAVWEHAKLNGVDFRAVGNEPGWSLEIFAGTTMTLVTDYGTRVVTQSLPVAESNPPARYTRWNGDRFEVAVFGTPCTDSMSGEHFSTRVEIKFEGRLFQGCGRALH